MTDVACFCGCCYSFVGDVGACPRCGEVTDLTGAPGPEKVAAQPASNLPERPARIAVTLTGA